MSERKKQIRASFRADCLARDGSKCQVCGLVAEDIYASELDVHHITDRTKLPNGGYVKENGISLCHECHEKAERYHITSGREWEPNMHPDDLYRKIQSSYANAYTASEKL